MDLKNQMILTYETGESFLKEVIKKCKENKITVARDYRKPKKYLSDPMIDGVWRHERLRDNTTSNLSDMGDCYRLMLRFDFKGKDRHGVKWNRKVYKSYKKGKLIKKNSYLLVRDSLKDELFPKLKKILESMGQTVIDMKTDTLGGVDLHIFSVQIFLDKELPIENKPVEKQDQEITKSIFKG